MLELPPELWQYITTLSRPKDRMFLAQVCSQFNKHSVALALRTMREAIIAGDIYSLVRLKNNKQFLNTPQLRDHALNLVIEYPNSDILMFLLKPCKSVIRFDHMYKIYFNSLLSLAHLKLAQKFVEYTLYNQGKSGMSQSASLYNSTRNTILGNIMYTSYDLNVACANGCARTLQSMMNYQPARVAMFNKLEELLVIATYFNHEHVANVLIQGMVDHMSDIIIRETVKRAILVAMSCGRLNLLRILETKCPREEAFEALCYEDSKYYNHYEMLIIEAIDHDTANPITILSILVYKNDITISEYLQQLMELNDEDDITSLIGELLCLSTKLDRSRVSLILISLVNNPAPLERFMPIILSNIMANFEVDIMGAILPLTEEMDCGKTFRKEYTKLKKALI